MKKLITIILSISVLIVLYTGCEDRTSLTGPSPVNGNVDLTRFVTLGNSLTAGYQAGSLYQSAQLYCYGNLIANQVGAQFEMPLISDPGIGSRMEIQSFDLAKNEVNIVYDTKHGAPINTGYQYPYNNLGVPGALLYDILNATSSTTCASYVFGNPATRQPNPYFDIVLRGLGSEFAQAKALHPTFVSVWIGNNDVLGYAASGGFSPSSPTPTPTFQFLYSQMADSIASLGAKVVVANIPNVTTIPYFTTVGPLVALETPWALIKLLGAPGIFYQQHGETIGTGVADSVSLLTGKVLVTLPGMNYATLIGKPTGQFYRDNHYPALPVGIDTTKPFGLHPQNPWPDALILDAGEIQTANSATADYNAAIASLAAAKGFGLVDINSVFTSIRQHDYTGGVYYNGVHFSTMYITGGLFGLDGVHPTDQGQAVIANEFIKVMNSKFGANIPLIDVSAIPSSIILAKRSLLSSLGIVYFEPGSFNHLLY